MLNNYDIKYIIKKIIIGVGIILILSFFNSHIVKAETIRADLTIGGNAYDSYYQVRMNANSTNNINFKTYSAGLEPQALILDICSNNDMTQNDNFRRTYNIGQSCPNSCYSNVIIRNELRTNCVMSSGYNGFQYRVYIPIAKYDIGAGCGQTGCHYQINDNLTFQNHLSWTTFADINGAYITDEIISPNDTQTIDKVNQSINNMSSNLQSSINSQTQQQHQDSLNEQNAINQNTQAQNETNNILNNDNVSGAEGQVDGLLNNSAFNDSSGIQSIINAPLNFINSLTNSCSPIQVTIPFINSPMSIPCIKQELNNHIPTIVPILSTAINGFIIYRILIDIVYLIKSARNPDDDRIEVLDL